MQKKFLLIAPAMVAGVFAATTQSWACSVCFTGSGDAVTDGFNASVLFLMSTPYLVIGSIVGTLIVGYRRALRLREQAEATQSEPAEELALETRGSGR